MFDDTIADSAKVVTAVLSTQMAVEFVDGWGKVLAWFLGVLYVSLKLYKLCKDIYGKSKD